MVVKRKVTKKKVAKSAAGQKPATAERVSSSTAKKKGIAVKPKPKATSKVIALGESLVISGAVDWREKMAAAISGNDKVTLNGGEVERIDGVGLQLLVALMKEAVNSNTTVSWDSASDVLIDGAAQLGLIEILGLDKFSSAR
jgi:anti-anti-sigma regulatory factor